MVSAETTLEAAADSTWGYRAAVKLRPPKPAAGRPALGLQLPGPALGRAWREAARSMWSVARRVGLLQLDRRGWVGPGPAGQYSAETQRRTRAHSRFCGLWGPQGRKVGSTLNFLVYETCETLKHAPDGSPELSCREASRPVGGGLEAEGWCRRPLTTQSLFEQSRFPSSIGGGRATHARNLTHPTGMDEALTVCRHCAKSRVSKGCIPEASLGSLAWMLLVTGSSWSAQGCLPRAALCFRGNS